MIFTTVEVFDGGIGRWAFSQDLGSIPLTWAADNSNACPTPPSAAARVRVVGAGGATSGQYLNGRLDTVQDLGSQFSLPPGFIRRIRVHGQNWKQLFDVNKIVMSKITLETLSGALVAVLDPGFQFYPEDLLCHVRDQGWVNVPGLVRTNGSFRIRIEWSGTNDGTGTPLWAIRYTLTTLTFDFSVEVDPMNLKVVVMNPYVPIDAAVPMAAQLLDGTGALAWITGKNPPNVQLFTGAPVIGPNMVAGDFNVPVFTGYSDVAMNGIVLQDSGGNWYIGTAAPAVFTAGAIGTPDIVSGVVITDLDTGNVLAAQLFDAPFAFDQTGDVCQVFPRIPLLQGQGVLV